MAKVIQLRARLPFVRTIEREGGSVFPLVRQRLPPLRGWPVSRHLSAGSEDGESPSEDGQSHSAESTASLWENYWKRRRVSVRFSERGSSACVPSLRVCPVSRHLSGSSEDGESPSEDGQSHSCERKGPLLFPVVRHLQQQVQQQLEA